MASAAIPKDNIRLETFCLIWLNADSQDTRVTEQKLRSIINRFMQFEDVQKCQKYIEEQSQKDRIVMIVSGRLGREIVPCIHKLRQMISIYVYCMDKEGNKQWADKFSKVKAVVVELDELVSCIKADHKIQKIVEEPLSINIFNAGKSTEGVNGQFVFYQVLIDCLLRLKSTSEDTKELIDLCKEQYNGNSDELTQLREFQQEYSPNKALRWYTRESFFYKSLNAALRTKDIHLIFLFRAYISDIQRHLKNDQVKHTLKVYRCQMISNVELKSLKKCCDQFISVNSFFSTSTKYEKALSFLDVPDDANNLAPVLFEIHAEPKMVTTKPFADISPYSEFPGESEILFMLGSIFRVNGVKRNKNGKLWVIRMTLCSDNELDLKEVLTYMKQQLGSGETNLQTLGKLLGEMGEPVLAGKYLIRLLEQLSPNHPSRGDLYEELGKLASQASNLDKSMEWRQKALAFKSQNQLTPISNSNETHNSTTPKETASKRSPSARKNPTLKKEIPEHQNEKELRWMSKEYTETNWEVTTHHEVRENKDHHEHDKYGFCLTCKKPLVDKSFAGINEKLYCEECYEQRSEPRCHKCYQTFKPGALILKHHGLPYHTNCFTCDSCSQSIGTNKYITKATKNYCIPCYERHFAEKCVYCCQVIKQNGITYKNEPWHRECFRCTNCKNTIIFQPFLSHNDRPYCDDCFDQLFAEKCCACNKPISGRNTTRLKSFKGRHWHNDCFRCQRCRTLLPSQGFLTEGSSILCADCGR